ncbi:MAG: hypothetical protein HYU97_01345 [Deltaproteobacteria bacterium]|nr:hypothetical protein [Deltaproteobacteria bacterium]
MKIFWLCLLTVLFIIVPLTNSHAENKISMSLVASNGIDQELPLQIFQGKPWHANPKAQYVKVHLYPDESFPFKKIEVIPCNGEWNDSIVVYRNFDEGSWELTKLKPTVESNYPFTARSLTFNFRKNAPLCLKAIKIYKEKEDAASLYTFEVPRVVKGTALASHTYDQNYDVMNLFDSRFEYAWSTAKITTGVSLRFNFDQGETVEKLRIWNGYQRSDIHCFSNARVKTFLLEGDNGYHETVTLKDIMGFQDVALPKPFTGKELTMTVQEAYPGKQYQDLVVSELRFFDGKGWFMLNPLQNIQRLNQSNANSFTQAGVAEILNNDLMGAEKGSKGFGNWNLRLRSDGSMFMDGLSEKGANYLDFYALGNYEVIKSQTNQLDLKIFGFLKTTKTPVEMDCNGCGRDCNLNKDPALQQSIFIDYITLKKMGAQYIVTHTKPQQRITFKQLELKLE